MMHRTLNARASDPATSHEAARPTARKEALKVRALRIYYVFPDGLTADEVQTWGGFAEADGIWKRCSDLKRDGLIEPTGKKRPGPRSRNQEVRAITSEGRLLLLFLDAQKEER